MDLDLRATIVQLVQKFAFYSDSSDNKSMKFSITLMTLLIVSQISAPTLAQDGPRFQPARPPPLDNDFDDPIEEEFDAPPPPMPQPNLMPGVPMPQVNSQTPSSPPATSEFRPSNGNGNSKLRFEIVEGEYFEKGKPRGRAPIEKKARSRY